jgi:hypothetical protein
VHYGGSGEGGAWSGYYTGPEVCMIGYRPNDVGGCIGEFECEFEFEFEFFF